jgi:hypothetical protein
MTSLPSIGILVTTTLTLCEFAGAAPADVRQVGVRFGNPEYKIACEEQVDCDTTVSRLCPNGNYRFVGFSASNFQFVCKWDEPRKQPPIKVAISPECSPPNFVGLDSSGKPVKAEPPPRSNELLWDPSSAVAMSYKDARTSITIRVDSDGRHLSATDAQGKFLWARNPWEESHFCPYRTLRPVVFALTNTEMSDQRRATLQLRGANVAHSFVDLTFDSSQYGVLDESTGDFFPEGQN